LGSFTLKVHGGKMVRAKVDAIENRLKNIVITGDFFAYPEDIIENIENSLLGSIVEFDAITKKIESIIKLKNATLLGVKSEHLAEVIVNAMEEN
jgi:hypothetical protein